MSAALPETLLYGTPRTLRNDLELLVGPDALVKAERHRSTLRIFRFYPEILHQTLTAWSPCGARHDSPSADTLLQARSREGRHCEAATQGLMSEVYDAQRVFRPSHAAG
jgi:hypothetical protein